MAYTWAEWKALVLKALTDRKPDDTVFTNAAAEYVQAKLAQQRGDGNAYALHQNRYTALRRAMAGYQTTLADSALKTAVKLLLRDAPASTTNTDLVFNQAVADYVRAQLDRGNEAAMGRFAQARLRLMGYETAQSDGMLQTAVKVYLTDGKADDNEFARAVALYMRAEMAREIDARDAEGGGDPRGIYETCRADYERARLRLAGYTPTGGFSQTTVNTYLPVESLRVDTSTYRTGLYTTAVEDLKAYGTWLNAQILAGKQELQGLGAWLDGQVLAARADLNALNERVQTEIRAGAIDLQHHIRFYTEGQTDTLVAGDITVLGEACTGAMPADAQFRSARIRRYYTDEDDVEQTVDQTCEVVPWADRFARMIDARDCAPQIAISPHGTTFILTPLLVADEAELLLEYDGTKLDFEDADTVPLDEPASLAVAKYVNAAMALEWGEAVAQQQVWRGSYLAERSRLYLRAKRRSEVQA